MGVMGKAYLFYNPLAGDGRILEDLDALEFVLDETVVRCDMTKPETYEKALFAMEPEDYFVVCGGDGTLNRFVNLTMELHRPNAVYYYPAGHHNDFARDFGRYYGCNPYCVTEHLCNLAKVRMDGRSGMLLTGILFLAEPKIRRICLDNRRYNDANTPKTMKLTVDGKSYRHTKVSFAAVMQGRHCGGGLIPDPDRRRTDDDLSCVIIHGCGSLYGKYLCRRLRKNRPIRSRHLEIHRGREINITFDTPVQLYTDGEIQTDVTEAMVTARERRQ